MVFGKKATGAGLRFQSFDLLSTLIAVVSTNGSVLFANAALEDALGTSRRTLEGSQFGACFHEPHVLRTAIDGDFVLISISDNGGGLPEHVRPRVFDPIFTTKQVGRGTRQGLSIAHNVVVKGLGGGIHFETELGRGTTFHVRLPMRRDDDTGAETLST